MTPSSVELAGCGVHQKWKRRSAQSAFCAARRFARPRPCVGALKTRVHETVVVVPWAGLINAQGCSPSEARCTGPEQESW